MSAPDDLAFEFCANEDGSISVRLNHDVVVYTPEEQALIRAEFDRLKAENAKLRELVRILKNCADECGDCDSCPINDGPGVLNPWLGCDSLRDRMRELGVEVGQ